ncbi:MAG: S41 family peptidase [bacterium]|nr:S41 family peptidase [bacterium]
MSLRKIRLLILIVAIGIGCGYAGYLLGQKQLQLSFRNYRPAVVLNKSPQMVREVDFNQFWIVWDKLAAEYVDKSALDPKKMVDGAISGMVNSLGDPYTVYLPKKQNEEAKQDLNGSFEGVGIQLGFKDNRLAVISPLAGTPADLAGVKPGDLILHIKDEKKKIDQDTDGLTIPEAVNLIRGPKGQPVILTLWRTNQPKPFDITLVRDTIVVKSASVEFIADDTIAHLKLNRFGDRTQEEWTEAVSAILTKIKSTPGFRGIILDLRNNPGGYLEGSVYLAGEFLQAGKLIVSQQFGDGTKVDLKVSRNGQLLKTKLVVLVNEGSASAAEIMAGALRDHRRAQIVGAKSFGKGSVQQPDDFSDGSGIHVTIAKWLRPNGEWIDKVGILPDIEVASDTATDSAQIVTDPQLEKATELLK